MASRSWTSRAEIVPMGGFRSPEIKLARYQSKRPRAFQGLRRDGRWFAITVFCRLLCLGGTVLQAPYGEHLKHRIYDAKSQPENMPRTFGTAKRIAARSSAQTTCVAYSRSWMPARPGSLKSPKCYRHYDVTFCPMWNPPSIEPSRQRLFA